MSINVYLKNEVRDLPEFTTRNWDEGRCHETKFNGIKLEIDRSERLFFPMVDTDIIPSPIKEFVKNISLFTNISAIRVKRETGTYQFNSAEASVELSSNFYEIKIWCENLEDAQALLHMIKTGTIRPEESYEAPQCGKSYQQLEAELTATQQQLGEAWQKNEELTTSLVDRDRTINNLQVGFEQTQLENEKLQDELKLSEKNFAECRQQLNDYRYKDLEIRKLAGELYVGSLQNGQWPFCKKQNIASRINAILNTKS